MTALLPGGGYAEYAIVHESNALPVPEGLSLEEAAAIPETYFTVWTNVFDRGGLKLGETFLVHGGTSGIGVTAIQLAKAFGAKVIATVGSAEKATACLELGADFAINYREQDFVAETHGCDRRPSASISSSTWLAATTRRAITPPRASTAASCRSPSCTGRKWSSTCGR